MRPHIVRFGLSFALTATLAQAQPAVAATARQARLAMGSSFELTAVHADENSAWAAVEAGYAEIERLEAMISSWRESSETSAVNRGAGGPPVGVSPELFGLVQRALKVAELTGGAFDVTFAGVGGLWDFKSTEPALPDPAAIESALETVDYRRVALDPETRTIALDGGMRIGFGGIGKGFAANRAAARMRELGATGGLVNAGGDLLAFGRREDGSAWTVAIADPLDRDGVFAYLEVSDQAVVTSGDYESFVEIDGVRYAHILDPRTGYPVRDVRSVTVVCPDAELADALATAVFVLGREEGLALIDRLNGIEALLVDAEGNVHISGQLRSQFVTDEEKP